MEPTVFQKWLSTATCWTLPRNSHSLGELTTIHPKLFFGKFDNNPLAWFGKYLCKFFHPRVNCYEPGVFRSDLSASTLKKIGLNYEDFKDQLG